MIILQFFSSLHVQVSAFQTVTPVHNVCSNFESKLPLPLGAFRVGGVRSVDGAELGRAQGPDSISLKANQKWPQRDY